MVGINFNNTRKAVSKATPDEVRNRVVSALMKCMTRKSLDHWLDYGNTVYTHLPDGCYRFIRIEAMWGNEDRSFVTVTVSYGGNTRLPSDGPRYRTRRFSSGERSASQRAYNQIDEIAQVWAKHNEGKAS